MPNITGKSTWLSPWKCQSICFRLPGFTVTVLPESQAWLPIFFIISRCSNCSSEEPIENSWSTFPVFITTNCTTSFGSMFTFVLKGDFPYRHSTLAHEPLYPAWCWAPSFQTYRPCSSSLNDHLSTFHHAVIHLPSGPCLRCSSLSDPLLR